MRACVVVFVTAVVLLVSTTPALAQAAAIAGTVARPSVAPDTHHGWPVARPKLSTVGCAVTRNRAGGTVPMAGSENRCSVNSGGR